MVASVAHNGRFDFAEAKSDIQTFFQNFMCQDNKLTQWSVSAHVIAVTPNCPRTVLF